MILDQQFRSN